MKSPEKLAGNIWFHSLHVPKIGWMRTGYQGCVRATRRKVAEIKPDIVHGQGTERDCGISAVFSGFPNVLTLHGNMRLIAQVNRARPFSFGWLAAKLEAFTLPKTDGVVCITHYTQEAVAPLVRRTWVIPNAVDAGFFDINTNATQPPLILYVANTGHRKNQNFFIRALDDLAKTRDFRVLFLGSASQEDPFGSEFLELVSRRPWCRHEGFASREKLKQYLGESSILALASLEDNCPMVVLEAMAAGVPVVASRVGGIPDLIENRKTGLFCDPLDAQSIRTSVAELLDDGKLARQIAGYARETARRRFLPVEIARRHLEIYREVLNTSR